MTQIEKLRTILKEWAQKSDDIKQERNFCRDHNFNIEAQILNEKADLIDKMCMSIELKVIDEIIEI